VSHKYQNLLNEYQKVVKTIIYTDASVYLLFLFSAYVSLPVKFIHLITVWAKDRGLHTFLSLSRNSELKFAFLRKKS